MLGPPDRTASGLSEEEDDYVDAALATLCTSGGSWHGWFVLRLLLKDGERIEDLAFGLGRNGLLEERVREVARRVPPRSFPPKNGARARRRSRRTRSPGATARAAAAAATRGAPRRSALLQARHRVVVALRRREAPPALGLGVVLPINTAAARRVQVGQLRLRLRQAAVGGLPQEPQRLVPISRTAEAPRVADATIERAVRVASPSRRAPRRSAAGRAGRGPSTWGGARPFFILFCCACLNRSLFGLFLRRGSGVGFEQSSLLSRRLFWASAAAAGARARFQRLNECK